MSPPKESISPRLSVVPPQCSIVSDRHAAGGGRGLWDALVGAVWYGTSVATTAATTRAAATTSAAGAAAVAPAAVAVSVALPVPVVLRKLLDLPQLRAQLVAVLIAIAKLVTQAIHDLLAQQIAVLASRIAFAQTLALAIKVLGNDRADLAEKNRGAEQHRRDGRCGFLHHGHSPFDHGLL